MPISGGRIFVIGEDIPPDIKTLAEACTIHFRSFSRLWVIAATISLLVIASTPDDKGNFVMLGIHMGKEYFYPVAAVFLGALNIAYCSAHLQAYHVQEIFVDLLKNYRGDVDLRKNNGKDKGVALGADKINFVGIWTLNDVAHALYMPALIRLYPISSSLPKCTLKIFEKFKLLAGLIFAGFPILGCAFATFKAVQAELPWIWVLGICIPFVISLILTLALEIKVYKWWRKTIDPDNS